MAGLILDSVRPRESGAQVWILARAGMSGALMAPSVPQKRRGYACD